MCFSILILMSWGSHGFCTYHNSSVRKRAKFLSWCIIIHSSKHGESNLHFPNIWFMSWKIITEVGLMSVELIAMMIWPIFWKWKKYLLCIYTLEWHHNGCDGISNHLPRDCLLKRLFRPRSKKTSKLSLAFVRGIHQWRVNSPHKGPITWKMFPFVKVILCNETGNALLKMHKFCY